MGGGHPARASASRAKHGTASGRPAREKTWHGLRSAGPRKKTWHGLRPASRRRPGWAYREIPIGPARAGRRKNSSRAGLASGQSGPRKKTWHGLRPASPRKENMARPPAGRPAKRKHGTASARPAREKNTWHGTWPTPALAQSRALFFSRKSRRLDFSNGPWIPGSQPLAMVYHSLKNAMLGYPRSGIVVQLSQPVIG